VRTERLELFGGAISSRECVAQRFEASVLTSRSRSPTLTSLISVLPCPTSALLDAGSWTLWLSAGAVLASAMLDAGSCATCSDTGVFDATTSDPDMVSQAGFVWRGW
jgi:hypothetical protein